MIEKFPIQIVRKNNGEEFTAVTSIRVITDASKNVRGDLKFVELDYAGLAENVKKTIARASKSKRTDVRLYWVAADTVTRFLGRIDDIGFYLVKQNRTLGRDTALSESTVRKLLAFRKRFTRISLVDPSHSWAKYRDNKVPVPR